ncbi:MAG: rubredoxin-like domain-containing protein [Peptoanaerobacter stomatis]|nr:rubrerythrin [Peptoanaerobacter stomatis]
MFIIKSWKCTICGYIHDGETPPEKCPICGYGPEKFMQIANYKKNNKDNK